MSKIEKAELSLDELDAAETAMARELTDAELEAVAGGKGGPGSAQGSLSKFAQGSTRRRR